LLIEVENLKNSSYKPSEYQGEDFNRSCNLIFYNTTECDSNRSDDRTEFDLIQVNNVIKSILVECNIIPIKVIRLGRYQKDKSRPIKVTFSSTSDIYEILKNKRKLSQLAPPSSINISTDRTQYQRDFMKKLRDELTVRNSNGEAGLTIKFFKGTPKIVSLSHTKQNNSQNFLN
jgi:hypothetical protein